jgi:hypothetical protein
VWSKSDVPQFKPWQEKQTFTHENLEGDERSEVNADCPLITLLCLEIKLVLAMILVGYELEYELVDGKIIVQKQSLT